MGGVFLNGLGELKNVVDEYPLVVTKLKEKLQSIIDECTSG